MERKLVNKVLTHDVFERDLTTRKAGPVLTTVKGWAALDTFLQTKGTKLIRSMWMGIETIQMPKGWDTMVISMENHYDDGSVEVI